MGCDASIAQSQLESLGPYCEVGLILFFQAQASDRLSGWSADSLGADQSKIGAKGSHTIVAELLELPNPGSRIQRVTEPPGDEAERIVLKIRDALAS